MLIRNYYIVRSDAHLCWHLPFSCKDSNYPSFQTEIFLVWHLSIRIQYVPGNNLVMILNKSPLNIRLDIINQLRLSSVQVLRHHRDHHQNITTDLPRHLMRHNKSYNTSNPSDTYCKPLKKYFLGKKKKKHSTLRNQKK